MIYRKAIQDKLKIEGFLWHSDLQKREWQVWQVVSQWLAGWPVQSRSMTTGEALLEALVQVAEGGPKR